MTKTSKGKKIFLIVLLSVLVLVLLGFMISVIMGFLPIRAFNLASYKVSSQLAYEDVFDASFQEIKVDATLGDIEVLPSTDEKTYIAIYSDSSLFDVEDNDSDLSIVFREEEGFHFSVPNTKDLIKVYVPVSTGDPVSIAIAPATSKPLLIVTETALFRFNVPITAPFLPVMSLFS